MYSVSLLGRNERSYFRSSSVGVACNASAAVDAFGMLKSNCECRESFGQLVNLGPRIKGGGGVGPRPRTFAIKGGQERALPLQWMQSKPSPTIANCDEESLRPSDRRLHRWHSSQLSRLPLSDNRD